MSDKVDPAIVAALGLVPESAAVRAHGGAGFSSTYRVTGRRVGDGDAAAPVHFFVKTGTGAAAETMFRGEYASLNAIADVLPHFCPRAYAHGRLHGRRDAYFLATDFLELGRAATPRPADPARTGRTLASKLAQLHSRGRSPGPGPGPHGASFGFPVTTCCGPTEQDNTWTASWADFFADRRLRHVLRIGLQQHGPDAALADAVERTAATVVPRLLRDGHLRRCAPAGGGPIRPALVHGDLWSGNHDTGRILRPGQPTGVEEVVYDPASFYGHAEYELGIIAMFGMAGFAQFMAEYRAEVGLDEPADEASDRMQLYQLYHELNHFAIFGGGYRDAAMRNMDRLLAKFGSPE